MDEGVPFPFSPNPVLTFPWSQDIGVQIPLIFNPAASSGRWWYPSLAAVVAPLLLWNLLLFHLLSGKTNNLRPQKLNLTRATVAAEEREKSGWVIPERREVRYASQRPRPSGLTAAQRKSFKSGIMEDFRVMKTQPTGLPRWLKSTNISQISLFSDPVQAISWFSGGLSCCSTNNLVTQHSCGELAWGKAPIK